MSAPGFEIVCEIEPPTRPDLTRVRHQIGVLSAVADAYLIPDNHIGRATVSSIAVAHEVVAMGGRSTACLNSRDRNLLGSGATSSPPRPTAWISSSSCTATSRPSAAARAS